MPSSLAECSADRFVSVGKLSPTRLCMGCSRLVQDRDDTSNKYARLEIAELSLWNDRHLAWSCACWKVDLPNRSHNRGGFVPEEDGALAGAFRKLASYSTSPLEEALSPAPLYTRNSPPFVLFDTTKNVVEAPGYTFSTIVSPVFKNSNSEKTEYRKNVLNAVRHAKAASLTYPDHFEHLRTMVREGR